MGHSVGGNNYDIEFRSTVEHVNADALFRLPLPEGGDSYPRRLGCVQIEMLPLSSQEIMRATR